jgi:hypothetical protein
MLNNEIQDAVFGPWPDWSNAFIGPQNMSYSNWISSYLGGGSFNLAPLHVADVSNAGAGSGSNFLLINNAAIQAAYITATTSRDASDLFVVMFLRTAASNQGAFIKFDDLTGPVLASFSGVGFSQIIVLPCDNFTRFFINGWTSEEFSLSMIFYKKSVLIP